MSGATLESIRHAAYRAGTALGAQKVILFGSYAEGTATRRSDVDLFIIVQTSLLPLQRLQLALAALPPMPCPVDVVVYTPDEVEAVASKFIERVLRTGVIIYERQQTAQ